MSRWAPGRDWPYGVPGLMDAVVVGAGLMGRWHAHAVESTGGDVLGVVDPDVARAERLAARHRGARSFERLEEALQALSAPVIHLCTPAGTHAPLAMRALAEGRHVLVEKPLAEDLRTTRSLLEAALSANRLLAPVHQFPFQRGVLRLLRDGDASLGSILHVRGTVCSAGAEERTDAERDRVALEVLPHFLSLAHAFVPGSLEDGVWSVHRTAPGEVRLVGSRDRTSFDILVSMAGRPTRAGLELLGTEGTAHADLFHGFSVIDRGGVSRASKIVRPLVLSGRVLGRATANLLLRGATREPAYPGLRELVRRFHLAAECGEESPVSPTETLGVARILEQVGVGLGQ